MANLVYDSFLTNIANGVFDMDGDTFKVALLGSGYTPNAGHSVFANVSASEVAGTGYTAGGKELLNRTWSFRDGKGRLEADDPVWTGATFIARYAVLYAAKIVAGIVNPLVGLIDFGVDKTVSEGDFTVLLNSAGIVTLG
ncbi:MAG: hypothetical protein AAGU21_01095 [Solidesulfovibrio sp.]|uniref:hypothetical protein n=1 Tax=Solidesulfovibrio sp. TaxID=2910990 RepID=UPI003157FED8